MVYRMKLATSVIKPTMKPAKPKPKPNAHEATWRQETQSGIRLIGVMSPQPRHVLLLRIGFS